MHMPNSAVLQVLLSIVVMLSSMSMNEVEQKLGLNILD